MKTIGIIGQGFVGTAVRETMWKHFEVWVYDKKYWDEERRDCYLECYFNEWGEGESRKDCCGVCPYKKILSVVDGPIFVCLPTPMNPDGSCNVSIVKSVLAELDSMVVASGSVRDVIIKSTMPLGMTRQLSKEYQGLNLIFNPEFLTEKNAAEDYASQNRIILGSPYNGCSSVSVHDMFERVFSKAIIIWTTSEIAEIVKYATNVFLATKVSLANELWQVWYENAGNAGNELDWDYIVSILKMDKRLGESHWQVPGECGKPGFGGSCFPKDLNAMIYIAKQLGIKPTVMEAVWKKNLEVRPERDWEELKGRAVTENGE